MSCASDIELDVERKFEVYNLRWTVEHFSLVSLDERWSVLSPEFRISGYHDTCWQMGLGPASGPGAPPDGVVFRLMRRDGGDRLDIVRAEWRLEVTASSNGEEVMAEGLWDFAPGDEHQEGLQEVRSSMVRSMDADHALFRCTIIVSGLDQDEDSEDEDVRTPEEGKRRLADDLLALFTEGHGCDLLLRLRGDRTVMAHKAILCARIDGLYQLLEAAGTETVSGRTVDVVDLSHVEEEALRAILEYVYSGDVRRLLDNPSMALLDAVDALDVYHLRRVFATRELCFRTSLRVRETRVTWVTTDFADEFQPMASPDLPDDDGGTTWRLRLYPSRDHISVSLEGEVGSACAEFAISDETGRTLHSRCVRSSGALRIERFVFRAALRNLLGGAALRLTMLLRRPASPPESYLERKELTVVSVTLSTDPLDLLSRCMHDLLDLPDFSDVRLRCDDGGIFQVHRALLGFRCDHLRNLFNDAGEGSETVQVSDVSPHVLYLLLSYLYRGVLIGKEDRREVAKLRDVARTFRLPLLVAICEAVLTRRESI